MNKLWYSLALTLFGSSSAFAQVVAEVPHNTPQEIIPAAIAEETIPAPVSEKEIIDNEQTIFFSDEILEEEQVNDTPTLLVSEIEPQPKTIEEKTIPDIKQEVVLDTKQENDNQEEINTELAPESNLKPQVEETEEIFGLLPQDIIDADDDVDAEIAASAKAEADSRMETIEKQEDNSAAPMPAQEETQAAPMPAPQKAQDAPMPAPKEAQAERQLIAQPVFETVDGKQQAPRFNPDAMLKSKTEPAEKEASAPQPVVHQQDDHTAPVALAVEESLAPTIEEKVETKIEENIILEPKKIMLPSSKTKNKAETLQKETTTEANTETKAKVQVEKKAIVKTEAPQKDTTKEKTYTLPEINLSQPKKLTGPFVLDEKAPINPQIMNNNSFAPSLLNKKIGISPEQRAKMLMKKKFDEMDNDGNGVISEQEFVTYKTEEARKIAGEIFKRVDKNSNNELSQYEYEILMNKMIESYIKAPKTK